jgi:hypothetical protein
MPPKGMRKTLKIKAFHRSFRRDPEACENQHGHLNPTTASCDQEMS